MLRMGRALLSLSVAEWRHHPWRHGVALLAVALGVALASSVQMINESALAEFSQALRAVNGQPDAVLAATGREGFADTIYARLALDESVALVSPVLEIDSQGRRDGAGVGSANVALRIVGVDALKVAAIAPGLMPRPEPAPTGSDAGAASLLDPDAVFLNPAASAALELKAGDSLALQSAAGWQRFRVVGSVAAGGAPLVVVDIAAAQARFGRAGRLSRLDLKLQTGVDPRAWQQGLAPCIGGGALLSSVSVLEIPTGCESMCSAQQLAVFAGVRDSIVQVVG